MGNQPSKVKKLAVLARSAGTALAIRKTAMAAMMTSTIAPAARVRTRNARSAPNAPAPGQRAAAAEPRVAVRSALPTVVGAGSADTRRGTGGPLVTAVVTPDPPVPASAER